MRVEENHQSDNVIAFRRERRAPRLAGGSHTAPETADKPEVPPSMVLNAERGIINTGTVHGGQHVTAIELSSHSDRGADGEV
ncbi:S-type pyocin domain-containing protein [Streptomyces noursei]|uniref:S-type pyocin domain-containing protein n=1 Tax=Streptomyces noursei TaxID=1971 RepID=UPI0016719E2F|nr:S-type pyocin domain-containing protein [Streptomyces noursei]MCZ1019595.1 S-type pyocin domain-containing protein [Streptomyces noursei]GGX09804.1 hypothetical protein GCM10010341_34380 [Streptomyces noursei]